MVSCKKIRKWLPLEQAGGVSPELGQLLEEHLRLCADCRRRWRLEHFIRSQSDALASEAERVMAGIDWPEVTAQIVRRARQCEKSGVRRFRLPVILRHWAQAAAVLGLLAAGGLLGLWLAHRPAVQSENVVLSAESLTRLETRLVGGQIADYLDQSQLLLADMMKQCRQSGISDWEMQMQAGKIKELLLKRKYFNPQLSRLEFQKARGLCDQIDFLFYDLAQIQRPDRCTQITRIQEQVRREDMLLKIRLLAAEFHSEFKEV